MTGKIDDEVRPYTSLLSLSFYCCEDLKDQLILFVHNNLNTFSVIKVIQHQTILQKELKLFFLRITGTDSIVCLKYHKT